jgi:TPR repeat protein
VKLPYRSFWLFFLTLCLCLPSPSFGQVGNSTMSPPKSMRLCIESGCNNLTWTGDHYDATQDGQSGLYARYWVVKWSSNYIELHGTTVAVVSNGSRAEGKFTGKLAADGESITDGRDDWHIGLLLRGTMPFTLHWTNQSAVPSASSNGPAESSKGVLPAQSTATSPSSPAGKSYEAMKTAHHQQLFTDDGCTRDTVPASGEDGFTLYFEGKQVQAEQADQQTDLNALRFFCAAFKAGYGPAAFEIGELYFSGFMLPSIHDDGKIMSDTVLPNMAIAFDWYQRAAIKGSSQGQIQAAWFDRNGPVIHFHSGDYRSVNPQPVDIPASMTFLKAAAAAGDTEALRDIIDLNTRGIDGAESSATRERDLAGWKSQLKMKMDIAQKVCLGMLPKIVKEELEAGRLVNGLSAAQSHDNSVICLVTLEETKTPDSIPGEIFGVLNGRPLASWVYTLYWKAPNGPYSPIRNSVSAEYMRQFMEYAEAVAPLANH